MIPLLPTSEKMQSENHFVYDGKTWCAKFGGRAEQTK